MTLQQFITRNYPQYINPWSDYLKKTWGLSGSFAPKIAKMLIALNLYGVRYTITSGRRSKEKQNELKRRYAAGDRSVVVKPADNSKHLSGNAIDIVTSNTYGSAWVAEQFGITSGIRFKTPDYVHYQE